MSPTQMEGDNTRRRARARQARRVGHSPSEDEVTLGASKQREHTPRSADHHTRLAERDKGKQQNHDA